MTLGGQTVGVVTVTTTGQAGFQGIKSRSRALALVHGCRFRQLSAAETPEGSIDVSSEVWKCTCPPEAAAILARSTGELVYDGSSSPTLPADRNAATVWRIEGAPSHKRDMDGSVHHVTILAKRQVG